MWFIVKASPMLVQCLDSSSPPIENDNILVVDRFKPNST